jgi:hypothetical protein
MVAHVGGLKGNRGLLSSFSGRGSLEASVNCINLNGDQFLEELWENDS